MTFLRFAAATAAAALLAAPALAQPAAPAAPAAAAPAATGDFVATLQAKGNFTTFLKLIDAAGLTPTLHGLTAATVFAPTDQAFAALPAGMVDNWMKPETKSGLQHLMLYHIVNLKLSTADMGGHIGNIATGAGDQLTLDGTDPAKLKINDSNVLQADIPATNGNIFALDKVLAPKS